MPTLPTRSFQTVVTNTVAGIQGRAAQLIDFGQGSPLRAIVEGFAGLFMWFQALALKILAASRLSTSSGTDVDTFAADFMPPLPGSTSPRLGSATASGQLTFSRFTAAASTCFIAVGATAQTADGTQDFVVTADPTNSHYSATTRGYTLGAGLTSITVPAVAKASGTGGNVQAAAISVITSPIIGIDAVTNAAAFAGGADSESDAAFKARFAAWILGLSRGDVYGLTAAILGTNITVQWTLTEDYDHNGAWHPGYFFVVCDDGSGSPSLDFVQAVRNAVYSVRPLGVQAGVFHATVKNAAVSLMIETADGYDHNVVVGIVADAVTSGINGLGLGVDLDVNRIPAWAYAVPGVTRVSAVTVNSLTGDAASISASTATQDGLWQMGLYTIKCSSCVVS